MKVTVYEGEDAEAAFAQYAEGVLIAAAIAVLLEEMTFWGRIAAAAFIIVGGYSGLLS